MERYSLDWIDSAKSRGEFEERYDEWASTYDSDLVEDWKYRLPAFVGDLVVKYVKNRDSWILDVGAGTGLGGVYLSQKG